MRFVPLLLYTTWLTASHVQAAAVFAHFMVGNVPTWGLSDWKHDIRLATKAHIDAFALNMAYGWYANEDTLALAFEAAEQENFQLFFSFDYAGNGSWPQEKVISLIKKYGSSSAYFQHKGRPFVSTFEGPGNAGDWGNIKTQTGCFFVPDWSSLGAIPAADAADGVVDGLFNWASWPWGNKNMTTFIDASYLQTLNETGKPYMMPVSPWFYTNMPGYDKNWLWRGDDTWYQRWQQIWYIQPEFVQIISWNDYGESHYIGPLDDRTFDAFKTGRAPFNYAKDMPHDGWREMLPFLIDTYKNGRAYVDEEKVVVWYRPSLAGDCDDGKTSGNTASQLQLEFNPADVSQDRVFFSALLQRDADVAVYFDGGIRVDAEWDFLPPGTTGFGGAGIYHGSVPLQHAVNLEVHIIRSKMTIFSVIGNQSVSADNCVNGLTNWNAWVGANPGLGKVPAVYPAFNLEHLSCVAGYSVDKFTDLCEFTCSWGYCPIGACVCSNLGIQLELPPTKNSKTGYPANGDANYAGLCTFACAHGYCPEKWCSEAKQQAHVPTSSPFDPDTCTKGSGEGSLTGLCSYACNFGFCPRQQCSCQETGPLIKPPDQKSENKGISLVGPDSDLCNFACTRGYCPEGVCAQINPIWGDSCDSSKKNAILEELEGAIMMATTARDNLQKGEYYQRFFATELRKDPKFAKHASEVFGRVAGMLSGAASYKFTITCDNSKPTCRKGFVAYMNDPKQEMNFCDRFFTDTQLQTISYNLWMCEESGITLREAHRSPATIILHEATHTRYVMGAAGISEDYAYGITDCLQLAEGTFDRSCASYKDSYPHLCNVNGKMGICNPRYSGVNADSWALVAAGIYYSVACNKKIEIPSGTTAKRDACPIVNDPPIVWDGEAIPAIDGYAHFGDSYAAGMGTGSTSSGSCRVGSNNYGKLLYEWFDNSSIPIESKACSGDTVTGLARQVKEWKNPGAASLGTVTIGGNDVGFSDLVKSCVITFWTYWNVDNPGQCEKFKQSARALIEDASSSGLRYKLKEGYKSILSASGRSDFQLYVPGYVSFFNADTKDCDDTTFYYWRPGYKPTLWNYSGRELLWIIAMLKTDLRRELNQLVEDLNSVIQQAIKDVNSETKGDQVHYVNVQPYFDNHRWCENADGSWHEPNQDRVDTYFFLSLWPDVSLSSNGLTTAEEEAELSTLIQQGSIPVPDAATCRDELGTDPDPYAVAMCDVATEVARNSTGIEAQHLAAANEALASGNYTADSISFYLPTNRVKTFHPRSPGMMAYRNAITDALQGY